MFVLVIRDGAPAPIGRTEGLVGSVADTQFYSGQAITLSSGKAVSVNDDTTSLATHIVDAKVKADGTKSDINAFKIEPGMIFRVPITAAPASALAKGAEVAIEDGGLRVTATAVSGSVRGARLEEAVPTNIAAGDYVLVSFPRS